MNKEILVYGAIYSYSTAEIIAKLDEAKDSDVTLRVNTPGGDPLYSYGIIAKFSEHPKRKTVKVDGRASSAGAFFCCYADYVECLDVSEFLFHRAAYPDYIESSLDYFTEDMRKALINTNKNLRAAMEGKFTAEQWESVTGVPLDDLFSLDSRIDVTLDANQAKKLGLVNKVNTITPDKKAEIETLIMGMAAMSVPKIGTNASAEKAESSNPAIQKPKIKMTKEQLKAEHPEVYAAVYNEGVTKGTSDEKDRVEAYLEFADVDLKAVKEGIEKGTAITSKAMAEFSRKAIQQASMGAMQEENAPEIATEEIEKGAKKQTTPDAKAAADFDKEWKSHIGLKA